MTKGFQSAPSERKSLIDTSLEIEELKLMLVKEQEYNYSLNKVQQT